MHTLMSARTRVSTAEVTHPGLVDTKGYNLGANTRPPAALTLKSSTRVDWEAEPGQWRKVRPGAVKARFSLTTLLHATRTPQFRPDEWLACRECLPTVLWNCEWTHQCSQAAAGRPASEARS